MLWQNFVLFDKNNWQKWNDCHYHVWHFSSVFAECRTTGNNFQYFQAFRNTLCKLSEIHFARYQKCTNACILHISKIFGSLNEFSISGGSKWQMSALPKFELNLQICERSTHPHQFEMAWLYLIKYGLLAPPQNSDCLSKCILGATLHWDLINLTCW